LANALAQLPMDATVADVASVLETFFARDAEYREKALSSISGARSTGDWLNAVWPLCDWLKSENERFLPDLMVEWILEDK